MQRLKRRRDFVAASKARSYAAQGAVVQRRERGDNAQARVGFTATRKLGGAVMRNRIRRRLKEAVRLTLNGRLQRGADYVFIARMAGLKRPFGLLQADLIEALDRLEERALAKAVPEA